MKIIAIDQRHPFTVALSYAIKAGRITPSVELAMREELQGLVAESAKKFTGFQNQEAIRSALDFILGVLSLAVVHSTQGKEDLEAWSGHLIARGLKALTQDAIAMLRMVSEASAMPTFWPCEPIGGETVRDLLLRYATRRHENSGVWIGYAEYRRAVEIRNEARNLENLLAFIIEKFTGKDKMIWIQSMERASKDFRETRLLDEIFNNWIFRICTGLPIKGDVTLRLIHFSKLRESYEADKALWIKEAKKRYDDLVEQTPPSLLAGFRFRGNDWFRIHLSKGPPKIAKRTNLKGISIPGITGIYLYSFFE